MHFIVTVLRIVWELLRNIYRALRNLIDPMLSLVVLIATVALTYWLSSRLAWIGVLLVSAALVWFIYATWRLTVYVKLQYIVTRPAVGSMVMLAGGGSFTVTYRLNGKTNLTFWSSRDPSGEAGATYTTVGTMYVTASDGQRLSFRAVRRLLNDMSDQRVI